jgi:beta-N-acetylhexosaminidase
MTRRVRWVVVLATVLCAASVVLLVRGSDDTAKGLPEAGSHFGAGSVPTTTAVSVPPEHPRPATPLGRRVARLFLIGLPGADPDPEVVRRLAARGWGGVVLDGGNRGTDKILTRLSRRIVAATVRAGNEPPIVGAVQPGPGPVPSPAAARAQAQAAGRQLRRLGIRLALAPLADLGSTGGPWAGSAYSDDPAVVAAQATAALQGWRQAGVAAAPGHFPGEGAASADPTVSASTVGLSLDELRRADLRPFAALARRAPAVQLSAATYAAFDGVSPATVLPEAVALLRRDMHFTGAIVSANLAAASLGSGTPVAELAVQALRAGCDLLWIPGDAADQDDAWRAVIGAVHAGTLPQERVDEALGRISVLRATYGVR